ncbi:Thiosulfate sulfurtransferase GlpE [Candidatus Methanobinarius endosymbioticus]|uniref:Thiosulfate sulfurtransferase GlpE n=1 Tax=Candidatus Methanobinarius endosymbioticus TaxID=2006182 RepID=A0A366MEL6_9EURY|nr:Thiosulfate sulfurtransferase GlpE [Candidatus Methanobinarius endosymbioticus]
MNNKEITPEEAKSELKENNDIILLDVRTKEEYDEKYAPNCILIPLNELSDKVLDKIKNKKQEIIIYCRSGRRSKKALEILNKSRYTNISFIEGGIDNWKYETE